MGNGSAKHRRSKILPAANDEYFTLSSASSNRDLNFKKVIKRKNQELKVIAESYNDVIIPSIKSYLGAVVQCLDHLLSGVATISRKANSYPKIVNADLNKLMVPSYLIASRTLEETMDRLHLHMNRISKRQRSMKRWRRVCTAVVRAVVVGLTMVSFGFAIAGATSVAVAAATSGITVITALESLVNPVLEEKELKLKQQQEVVEMMRNGEELMVHEFNGVRRLTEEIIEKYSNFVNHINTADKTAPEMEKMIDEMESDAMELKGELKLYRGKIEQFEVKFNRMIQNYLNGWFP